MIVFVESCGASHSLFCFFNSKTNHLYANYIQLCKSIAATKPVKKEAKNFAPK